MASCSGVDISERHFFEGWKGELPQRAYHILLAAALDAEVTERRGTRHALCLYKFMARRARQAPFQFALERWVLNPKVELIENWDVQQAKETQNINSRWIGPLDALEMFEPHVMQVDERRH